jgi:CRP-like cAMP-binding protein
LFADLPPAGLVWVASQGEIHQWQPGEVVVEEGAISDALGVVLAGSGRVSLEAGALVILGPGETIGEMGVITGAPRSKTVKAGPEGLRAFQVPRESFEELLHRSRYFSRGLLRQLAERLTASRS